MRTGPVATTATTASSPGHTGCPVNPAGDDRAGRDPDGGVRLITHAHPGAAEVAATRALIGEIAVHDLVSPADEQNVTELGRTPPAGTLTLADIGSEPVGFAWQEHSGATALAVHPGHRRRGIGSALLGRLSAPVTAWAHGTLPGSEQLARTAGLTATRRLHRMLAPLTTAGAGTGTASTLGLPDGFEVGRFDPRDAAQVDALVEVNARAFADLPDQGGWTADDFADRFGQDWFDPADLLLVYSGEELAGFHWVKLSDRLGEVYVIGISPDFQGRGLGRTLLDLGLAHLTGKGAEAVDLYVDADNTAAVRMYRRSGFAVEWTDTWFAPAES